MYTSQQKNIFFPVFGHKKTSKLNTWKFIFEWCGRRDLNSHGLLHYRLKIARLPVPPRPHMKLNNKQLGNCGAAGET